MRQNILFKSYYVVWKQNSNIRIFDYVLKFKSYYVVWKPLKKMIAQGEKISLNRTMQYGNIWAEGRWTDNTAGLNRTMQYGNCCERKITQTQIMFKSYYVVWKPRTQK